MAQLEYWKAYRVSTSSTVMWTTRRRDDGTVISSTQTAPNSDLDDIRMEYAEPYCMPQHWDMKWRLGGAFLPWDEYPWVEFNIQTPHTVNDIKSMFSVASNSLNYNPGGDEPVFDMYVTDHLKLGANASIFTYANPSSPAAAKDRYMGIFAHIYANKTRMAGEWTSMSSKIEFKCSALGGTEQSSFYGAIGTNDDHFIFTNNLCWPINAAGVARAQGQGHSEVLAANGHARNLLSQARYDDTISVRMGFRFEMVNVPVEIPVVDFNGIFFDNQS